MCAAFFVVSIIGLVISSIAGNNAGWVVPIGMVGVTAAVVLIVATLVGSQQRTPEYSDVEAAKIEDMVSTLVGNGADEETVRSLVRASVQLGRGL